MVKAWRSVSLACLLVGLSACSLFNSEEDVVQMAPVPEFSNQFTVAKQWETRVGDGVEKYFSALSPVVAYDSVFAASRFGEIRAFDLNGERLWQQNLSKVESNNRFSGNTPNARVSGGLTAAYKRIYLGTENADVFALDAETGEIVWQAAVSGEVLANPAVEDSVVVVMTSNGHLVALDAHSGEQKWDIKIDQPSLSLRSKAPAVISNGAIILGRSDGKIGLYLLESGQLLFESKLAQPKGSTEIDRIVDVDSRPVLVGSQLYAVAYNGNLVSVNLRSGEEQWRRSYSAYQNLATAGLSLFVTDVSDNVYSIERNNGVEQWTQGALSYRIVTAPAIDGNQIIVGDSEGYLYWINRETGEFTSKMLVDKSGLYVAPVVTSDKIIVQTRNGKLIALDRS
ncbi:MULTISPECIES: outer membrane protein assembly factor BamB [unclassified Agarivorans]|uniref:outer membrane protein assembly factor BamB n=1 Tax=unclassified Agarivorans TaxID=2636026 RepID=UPI0026E3811D|nr:MULTISPECIES: outer membrane protein assembly factor BamB [unclassified Agarivorans]MDO6687336.1 outer membrane protein assembly factor BamB [Agarivorans sp. 3_MG-2023]MDO6716994.1 outer membrane protein assembly factor BamB [Agarivorans sp. 2_MG-2023]